MIFATSGGLKYRDRLAASLDLLGLPRVKRRRSRGRRRPSGSGQKPFGRQRAAAMTHRVPSISHKVEALDKGASLTMQQSEVYDLFIGGA